MDEESIKRTAERAKEIWKARLAGSGAGLSPEEIERRALEKAKKQREARGLPPLDESRRRP